MSAALDDPLFIRACFGQPTERTPIWLMRQAGRYMADYRAIREKVDFLELCHSPELCCEVTLQPINAFGFDASIVFSDLLVPLPPMGAELTFGAGMGPVITNGVSTVADVDRLRTFAAKDHLDYVGQAIKLIVGELPKDVPLIGFAGCPFTLASYLIEGSGSKVYMKTKAFLNEHPEAAHRLFDKLTTIVIDFLNLQIDAGCRAVQLFDSWVGCLDPADYVEWGLKYTKRIVDGVRRPGVPVIVFAKGTGAYLDLVAQCGADVIGVDWTLTLDKARALVQPGQALQGNLDPGRLLGPWDRLRPAIDRVLDAAGDGTGHVFNLGHGIHKTTSIDTVKHLVDYVQGESSKWRE